MKLDEVRNRVNYQTAREEQPAREPEDNSTGPFVGDRVRILNRVRLSGSVAYSRGGVEGVIVRFGAA